MSILLQSQRVNTLHSLLYSQVNCVPATRFILAEILVAVGGAILPTLAVPASTRISARLKRVRSTAWQFTCEGGETLVQVSMLRRQGVANVPVAPASW